MLGVVGAFLLFRSREHLRLNGTIAGLLLTYFGWVGLSATWADDPSLTIRRQIAFALMLVFAAGCVARMNVDVLSVFIAGIAGLNLIPGLIAELRGGTLHPFGSGNRFGGTLHPNLQGASLSLAIIVLCWWLWRTRGPVRLKLACTNIVLLTFMLMTRSRTSMFCLAAAIGFSVLIVIVRNHRDWLPRVLVAIACAVGLAGLVGLAITSSSVRPSILNSIRADRDDGDVTELTGRTDVWRTCLGFAAERPLLGFGFDGFWSEKRIEMISEELHWSINQGHSAYLDLLLGLGIPGAGLYILLLLGCFFTCVVRFLRGEDCYGAWAALLLFIGVHSATESISVLPTLSNFAFNLIVLHLAFVKPRALESRTSPASRRVPSRDALTPAGRNEPLVHNDKSLCRQP
jgi:O-antigen ligase